MTIDWWTLGIQSVNIVILIWLLGHFFWRPVAAMIEQRRTAAREALAQVEVQRTQISAALADIERTRAGFAGERDALLAAARQAAEQERAAILAKAATEAAALDAEAKAAAARDVEAANRAWTDRASRLAVAIAGRLVERLQGPAVQDAFMDGLLKAVRELPEAARLGATAPDVRLEAVSAMPIEAADQQRFSDKIGAALGQPARIDFKSDAALIAGFELTAPHFTVGNSWRGDLASILAELVHDS
jgi:F-type H+-transporting ATPase subunit b